MLIVVMGVTGSGKSSLAASLALRLGLEFHDADDFHPPANKAKMAANIALDDADRAPWLARIAEASVDWERRGGAVLACSALKQRYRDVLVSRVPRSRFVYLKLTQATVAARLEARRGQHAIIGAFDRVLDGQFRDLEEPLDAIVLEPPGSVAELTERAVVALQHATAAASRSALPERHVPVLILGAGLTGLSAALALQSAGVAYELIERSARVGGHATTDEEAEFLFDRTGHLLHLRSPELKREVLEWLDGDCVELERKSVVYSHGAYTRYPFQANTAGLPPEVAYECVLGFVRAHFQPPSEAPQDFETYCLQHFGAGFSKHFLLPYNQKLWGIPAREITAEWCQRFVPLPKLEDVLAGAFGLPDPQLGYNARFLYPRRGIGALPQAMAKRVQALRLNRAPRTFEPEQRRLVFEDEVLRYDTLISSIPLDSLLRLAVELPPELERAAGALRARNLYYLDLALSHPARQAFHWAYVPEPHLPFYRVGCYSNFSAALAPPGCSSLYVELSTTTAPELSEVLPRVLTGLQEMGLVDGPNAVRFARLRQLAPAYVLYDHAYSSSLGAILPWLEARQVIATGRYGAWNYSSMEDALLFGRDAAARVLAAPA